MDEDSCFHEIEQMGGNAPTVDLVETMKFLEDNLTLVDQDQDQEDYDYDIRSLLSEFLIALQIWFEEREIQLSEKDQIKCDCATALHDDLYAKMVDFKNAIDLEMEISKEEILEYVKTWLKDYADCV